MKHDSQSEISVNGYEEPYSYGRVVTYENSMDQIEAVIKISKECRQYIKVLKSSSIWNYLFKLLRKNAMTNSCIVFVLIFNREQKLLTNASIWTSKLQLFLGKFKLLVTLTLIKHTTQVIVYTVATTLVVIKITKLSFLNKISLSTKYLTPFFEWNVVLIAKPL